MSPYNQGERQWPVRNYWRQSFAKQFIIFWVIAFCLAPTTVASHSLVGRWACTFSQGHGTMAAFFAFKADGSEIWYLTDTLPVLGGIGSYAYDNGVLAEHMHRGFGEPGRGIEHRDTRFERALRRGFEPEAWISDSMRLTWESASHFRMRTPKGRAASPFDVVDGIYDCKRH